MKTQRCLMLILSLCLLPVGCKKEPPSKPSVSPKPLVKKRKKARRNPNLRGAMTAKSVRPMMPTQSSQKRRRLSKGLSSARLKKLEKMLDSGKMQNGMLRQLSGNRVMQSVIGAKGIGGADMNSSGGWNGRQADGTTRRRGGSARGQLGTFGLGGGGGSRGGLSAGLGGLGTRGRGSAGGGYVYGRAASRTPKKKVTARLWQRSKTRTFLSRVSVGDKKYLRLEKLRVTVQVEGLRVRTILDHIYYNPHRRTLEGKFKYTLPTGAFGVLLRHVCGASSTNPSLLLESWSGLWPWLTTGADGQTSSPS